jgi:phosphate transporter
MKFGKQLQNNIYPPWKDKYIPYARFKRMLKRKKFIMDQEKLKAPAAREALTDITDSNSLSSYGTYVDMERVEVMAPINDSSENTPLRSFARSLSVGMRRNISSANIDEFFDLLFVELHNVNSFFQTKLGQLSAAVGKSEDLAGQKYSSSRGHAFRKLCWVYGELVALRDYAELNYQGFRKIVKKYDKTLDKDRSPQFLSDHLEKQTFVVSSDPQHLIDTISSLLTRDKLLKLEHFAKQNRNMSGNVLFPAIKPWALLVSITVFVTFQCVNILAVNDPFASRCFSLLVFVVALWLTEALPYFATALLIPPLVVFMDVLRDPHDPTIAMKRPESSRFVLDHLVNHVTILILGGYTISAAFSRCEIELWVASKLQERFGHSPALFILSVMLLGLFLSMWISNHTAPVLCCSILLPIIRDYPTSCRFVKALLLGLAFACNFGGMMTPISSMQNALAVTYLYNVGMEVSFGQWILIALPFCLLGTVLSWLLIIVVLPPNDVTSIPVIMYTPSEGFSVRNVTVLLLSIVTILLWSTITCTEQIFGDLGAFSCSERVIQAHGIHWLNVLRLKAL